MGAVDEVIYECREESYFSRGRVLQVRPGPKSRGHHTLGGSQQLNFKAT